MKVRTALGRLLGELRRAPSPDEAAAVVDALRVKDEPAGADVERLTGSPAAATVGRDGGVPLDRATRALVVRLADGIYASVPRRDARVRLLRTALGLAERDVVLHVPVLDEHSHLARVVVDAPRRALRAVGLPAAEPGDRFGPAAFSHCFFDEEPLLSELHEAGLEVASRAGFTFVLRARQAEDAERPEAFAVEMRRALAVAREAERVRRKETPARALRAMRARADGAPTRGAIGRARLRRAISWVDAAMGASCYRRVLMELALDHAAARERVVFGLDVGRTGHAAFEGREDRTFDVAFVLGPADA